MTRRTPPFTGVLFTLLVAAAAFWLWRATRPAGDLAPPAAPSRGGTLVAAISAAPRSLAALASADEGTALLDALTQGRLVRLDPDTGEPEPWLAEAWQSSPDGRTHTLRLRTLTWSDAAPFTSADVVFSLGAARGARTAGGPAASSPLDGLGVDALDERTVVVTVREPSPPGAGLLADLPIYPKHRLDAALASGTLASAWPIGTAPSALAGTGPFVLAAYERGTRLVLERNPRYWRRAPDGLPLPYLDRLVLEIVPAADEALRRLEAGTVDLIHDPLPLEAVAGVRRAEGEGRLALLDLGVEAAAEAVWFCLGPPAAGGSRRAALARRQEFRQALSHAVDREAFAGSVLLGEAVPVWGPVTPGNRAWFTPNVPRYPPDTDRARALLASIGLEDRDADAVVEDETGVEARFTLVTARDGPPSYARGAAAVREAAARIGVAFDVQPLEAATLASRLARCDYDAAYLRPPAIPGDPARRLDFWLSSGAAHVWHPSQASPATPWEARIDALMREQAATPDPARRRALLDETLRLFGEQTPIVYLAAPRAYAAHATRVGGTTPGTGRRPLSRDVDSLYVRTP